MAIDSETTKALEARADNVRARRGEALRRAKEALHGRKGHAPGKLTWQIGSIASLRGILRFADIES